MPGAVGSPAVITLQRRQKRLAFFNDILRQHNLTRLADALEEVMYDRKMVDDFWLALTRWLL